MKNRILLFALITSLFLFSMLGSVQAATAYYYWKILLGGAHWGTPIYDDLDGDGNYEIVTVSFPGYLYMVDAETGEEIWGVTMGTTSALGFTDVADMDGDGDKEILVGIGGNAYIYNHQGTLLRTHTEPVACMGAKFGQLDADDALEYCIMDGSSAHCIRAFDDDGSSLWTYDIEDHGETSTLHIVDLNNDGVNEVVAGSDAWKIYAITNVGAEFWTSSLIHGGSEWVEVTDLNGDGNNDVIVGVELGYVMAYYGNNGTLYWECDFPDLGVEYGDAEGLGLVNLDGDGTLEIVASSRDSMRVYGIDDDGTILWTCVVGAYSTTNERGVMEIIIGDFWGDSAKEIVATQQLRHVDEYFYLWWIDIEGNKVGSIRFDKMGSTGIWHGFMGCTSGNCFGSSKDEIICGFFDEQDLSAKKTLRAYEFQAGDVTEHDFTPYSEYKPPEGQFPEFNLWELPTTFAAMFGISKFSAGVFCSSIFLFAFMLPIAAFSKSVMPTIVMGILILGLLTSIGWLPGWILLLIVLAVVVLWGSKIGGFGRGGE